jgi:REP element-mobilizing transposase RayT
MPRSPRIVEPGGVYHLTPRGNDGRTIFLGDLDREQFLLRLDKTSSRHGWIVLGYCLMDTHVHLLVQVPERGLSEGMQVLLSGYARWWNERQGHFGHVFLNRFGGRHVKSDSHFLAAARYIDLNPVAAKLTSLPEQWPWSSYRAHVGLEHPRRMLANADFLRFVGPTPDRARKAYARFVRDGLGAVSDAGLSEGLTAASDTGLDAPSSRPDQRDNLVSLGLHQLP